MLDYLEYPKYLKNNYSGMNKENIYKHVAAALSISSPRQVKGNFLVLNQDSSEDGSRYTAHQFTSQVVEDFEKLKSTS